MSVLGWMESDSDTGFWEVVRLLPTSGGDTWLLDTVERRCPFAPAALSNRSFVVCLQREFERFSEAAAVPATSDRPQHDTALLDTLAATPGHAAARAPRPFSPPSPDVARDFFASSPAARCPLTPPATETSLARDPGLLPHLRSLARAHGLCIAAGVFEALPARVAEVIRVLMQPAVPSLHTAFARALPNATAAGEYAAYVCGACSKVWLTLPLAQLAALAAAEPLQELFPRLAAECAGRAKRALRLDPLLSQDGDLQAERRVRGRNSSLVRTGGGKRKGRGVCLL